MEENQESLNHEKPAKAMGGWGMLIAVFAIFIAGVVVLVLAGAYDNSLSGGQGAGLVIPGVLLLLTGIILSPGFFTLEPNETRVLVLFGA